ncbi:MAG: bifunctional 4-hydroxy-3-methylbut-2-enyl diphosphate reductase/30S ribosomal protein S1, partial [Clostridia bacterium]|nr:bifunctional 4-hydroxy-3-methylbut-2-enyl diphosphate reductase/30S ribosomal protein S1 [Clostridia bacterium]
HGVGRDIYEYCNEHGINVIDNTCPFVAKVHDIVKNAESDVVIIGKSTHPEIIGIKGWVEGNCTIVDSVEGAKDIPKMDEATIVVQTTFEKAKYQEILDEVKKRVKTPKVFNTICNATEIMQKEALELSKQADCMVVVGGKHSSNTKKLYDICKSNCKNSLFIENVDELPLAITETSGIIGIVAGASTPDWIIREVITTMTEKLENEINEQGGAETAAAPLEEAEIKNEDTQIVEDYADLLEKTLKSIRVGEMVTGTVVQVNKDEIFINIGYKSDGIIPKNEYSADQNVDICAEVKIGDEIEAQVVKLNDGEGNVLLSVRRSANKKIWNELEEKFKDTEAVYSVTGKEAVNGGVIAEYEGAKIFIPASLLDIKFVKDLTQFVGQTFDIKVIEFDKHKKKIVGNRRVLLEAEAKKLKEELWNKFEPKQEIEGTVKRITDFGAFVDIGGIDGLLHVADIAWYRINHPSDVLKVNDKIKVVILSVNKEKERISLGLKQLTPKPWEAAGEKYKEGDVIKGKVVRVLDFGAFVELEPGIDGLIHISQIALEHIDKVSDKLNIGDEVECKVLSVDSESKKISLSIKQLLRDRMPKEEKPKEEKAAPKEEKEEEYIPEITESSVTIAEFCLTDF